MGNRDWCTYLPFLQKWKIKLVWMQAYLSMALIGSLSCLLVVCVANVFCTAMFCRKSTIPFVKAMKPCNLFWNSNVEQTGIKTAWIQTAKFVMSFDLVPEIVVMLLPQPLLPPCLFSFCGSEYTLMKDIFFSDNHIMLWL